MECDLAEEILKEGADAYNSGLMRGFSQWAERYPAVNGERELIDFYVDVIGSINSTGSSSRLYGISEAMQKEVFDAFNEHLA